MKKDYESSIAMLLGNGAINKKIATRLRMQLASVTMRKNAVVEIEKIKAGLN